MTKQAKIQTTWEVWIYDVWGNAADGFDVNDRSCMDSARQINCNVETHNPGTAQQFASATPTNKQLQNVFGISSRIETDGDDITIYVNRARDGYPIGELSCTSHESLSPIRVIGETPKMAMAHFGGKEYGPFPVVEEIPTQDAIDARQTISAAQQKVNAMIDDPKFHGTWNCVKCGEVPGKERIDRGNEPLCDNCYLASFIDPNWTLNETN